MPVLAFTVGSLGDILATAGLIAQVAQALYDTKECSNEYRDLMLELRSLHRALILSKDAVQRYEQTAMAESLSNTVKSEVDECHLVMQTFLNMINDYRKPLSSTGIRGLWRKVWWSVWEADELASLTKRLSTRIQRLSMLLIALNSVGLTDLRNEMRAGRVSMNQIATTIRRHPHPSGYDPENVWAVNIDHLTDKLTVYPNDPQNWYQLGCAYMVVQKYNRVYEAYQQAIYRDGKNPTFWNSVGELYVRLCQSRDALDAFARAIRLNPHISEVWFNLGNVYENYEHRNMISSAIDSFARASILEPSNTVVSQRLQLMRLRQQQSNTEADEADSISGTSFSDEMVLDIDEIQRDDRVDEVDENDMGETSDDGGDKDHADDEAEKECGDALEEGYELEDIGHRAGHDPVGNDDGVHRQGG